MFVQACSTGQIYFFSTYSESCAGASFSRRDAHGIARTPTYSTLGLERRKVRATSSN
jgi:hypothetical protein